MEGKTKVISFSLFGTDPAYPEGIFRNLAAAPSVYPGWQCWVYASQEIPKDSLTRMIEMGAKVIPKQRRFAFDGLFWRFLPSAESSVAAVICRDADSTISPREAAAVADWLRSQEPFHIMRDHPYHDTPVLAGLWGTHGGAITDIEKRIQNWGQFESPTCDQDFLNREIYPRMYRRATVHTEFVRYFGEKTKTFPVARVGDSYLGLPEVRPSVARQRIEDFRYAKSRGLKSLPLPESIRKNPLVRKEYFWAQLGQWIGEDRAFRISSRLSLPPEGGALP